MKESKARKLQDAGWIVGSASDFLQLNEVEETIVAMKLALAAELRDLREGQHLTQKQLATRIGSSQSRVAKMEVADKSVSIELFVRSLVSLGASQERIGRIISKGGVRTSPKTRRKALPVP